MAVKAVLVVHTAIPERKMIMLLMVLLAVKAQMALLDEDRSLSLGVVLVND